MKKLIAAALLPLFLAISTPSQAALEGDFCASTGGVIGSKFTCAEVKGRHTIADLYRLGYRVVAAYRSKQSVTYIIIEKQS